MARVICGRCRHEHPIGARICEACGSKLFALELRRAMGRNPWNWIQGTSVGQMAPFALVILLLISAALLNVSPVAWRQLLLSFGLVGLVTLGVTFPLMKGHYDFSAGSLAGLCACTAAVLSPYGFGAAIAGALAVGCLVGLANGFMVGWTRIPSAMVTVMTGAIALQLTMHATSRATTVVTDPLLLSLADTDVGGVPVILALFVVALMASRVLFGHPTFKPVGQAQSSLQAADYGAPPNVLLSFLVSGLAAGLAGLLIAGSSMSIIGSGGQMVWMLTPLTAALVGGGSVTAGTGNLRTAAIGAAAIALLNWLATQLRMPISGPIIEAPLLVAGLLADRWKNMTWYMIAQARRGNLLALPDEMQLPMVTRVWRRTTWPVRIASALVLIAVAVGLYTYIGYYVVGRVPEGTAIVSHSIGTVEVVRYGTRAPLTLATGDSLKPGDMVVTGDHSSADLRFADGSEVQVIQNTELYIRELSTSRTGATTTQLHVPFGTFFAKVHKLVSRDSSFSVQTPVLTLGVRGTIFQVSVGRGEGNVAVGEGAVVISRRVKVEEAGLTRFYEDAREVEAGRQAQAGENTIVRPMTKGQLDFLHSTEEQLAQQSKQTRLDALQARAHRGVWVLVIALYLIAMICLKPAPQVYIGDLIAERARMFTAGHARTAADSPKAAALAQMFMRAGNLEQARYEIQQIMEHDPNSEYGKWAQGFSRDLERQRRRATRG